MAAVDRKRSLEGDEQVLADVIPPRKRLKPSDLPISQTKRSIIDSLLHTFKKKGEFDALRKLLYAQFDSDVCITISTYEISSTARRNWRLYLMCLVYRKPKPPFSPRWSSSLIGRLTTIPPFSPRNAGLLHH